MNPYFKKSRLMTNILIIVLGIFITSVCFADDVIEHKDKGYINWTTAVIRVTGSGAPDPNATNLAQARLGAERVAKLDAYRNLLEIVNGVQISSNSTVKNYIMQDDVIRSKVDGIVKGAREIPDSKRYLSDGGVELTVEMKLTGELAELVLPQQTLKVCPCCGQPLPGQQGTQTPVTPIQPMQPVSPASQTYTGLVLNTKGLGIKPAMAPKILDESGREVYGSALVQREFAVQQGMVGYAKDISVAQTNERVTNNPMVIKGKKSSGPAKTDIVIADADADMIRQASQNMSFLNKCRVMIVVD